ncbi:hypothetical protein ACIRU3_24735 [Streptomyces sp. NPDC101151]|uniref:hypothetical protein n=1 Tax=Streptomyces sp. NPDC101151 TaxID=3366115 RepID=UPI0037FC224E
MRRLAPVCLALAAALLGCSSGNGTGGGGGPAGAAEQPASGGPAAERQITYTTRLPIARYSYTAAEDTAIESAQQVLTRRCMRTYGIAYEPAKPAPRAAKPADRRYGLSSASEAARFGYHPNSDAGPPPPQPDLPTDALPVFYGKRGSVTGARDKVMYKGKEVPADGCFGQSVRKLSKGYDDPAGAAVASRIATGSYEKSLTDPKVKDGFRKWSACMRNSGFQYKSPMEPLNNPAFQGATVSGKEKKTATADVRCKGKTELLGIWFTAESSIQQADIKKDAEALEKLRTAHRKKAEAARRIVAEG